MVFDNPRSMPGPEGRGPRGRDSPRFRCVRATWRLPSVASSTRTLRRLRSPRCRFVLPPRSEIQLSATPLGFW